MTAEAQTKKLIQFSDKIRKDKRTDLIARKRLVGQPIAASEIIPTITDGCAAINVTSEQEVLNLLQKL